MERLKGKTILIGKEPGQGRLAIVVGGKAGVLGTAGSVPNCVSRCKDGMAHCKITVAQDGSMTITNLKDANVTYVNGAEVMSKRIDQNSRVQLGKDRYDIDVKTVLQAAEKLVPSVVTPPPPLPPKKSYSIRHLKKVWNDYHDKTLEIAKRRNRIGLLSRIPMIFTLGSGSIAAVANFQDWGSGIVMLTTAMSVLGFVMMLYGFYVSYTDKSIEEQEELKEEFEQQYVCPNPDCRHYLDGRKYSLLVQDGQCRYCKCKFVE